MIARVSQEILPLSQLRRWRVRGCCWNTLSGVQEATTDALLDTPEVQIKHWKSASETPHLCLKAEEQEDDICPMYSFPLVKPVYVQKPSGKGV